MNLARKHEPISKQSYAADARFLFDAYGLHFASPGEGTGERERQQLGRSETRGSIQSERDSGYIGFLDTTAVPKTTPKAAVGTASSAEIAAAKASGKVWVNTESGVYHKSGRWYGKTKTGKFMTEAEAKAAGYKEAHK